MRTTIKRLAMVAACLTLAAGAAQAQQVPKRNWYILNFANGQCVSAKVAMPWSPTPELFHLGLRREGNVDEVKAHKGDDGELMYVTITANKTTTFWFPSPLMCEAGKQTARDAGLLPPPKEDLE